MPRRRILIANPNTSEQVTRLLAAAARTAAPEAEIVAATAPFGAASLECRAELAIAAHAVLETIAAHPDCEAAIIGAFGDPGLAAAREIAPMPVFGMGRCGLEAASEGGTRRFAVVTVGPRTEGAIREAAEAAGATPALAAVLFLPARVLDLAADPQAHAPAILAAARTAIEAHGAHAILFAGAPFSGLAPRLGAHLPVPAYDGLSCALAAARSAPLHQRTAPARRPETDKAMPGVSAPLAELVRAILR